MPLTVLASVSLLALVVTGRPLLAPDPRLCVPLVGWGLPGAHDCLLSVEASGEVQNAVQAIIESRLGYVRSFESESDSPLFLMIVIFISPLPFFHFDRC